MVVYLFVARNIGWGFLVLPFWQVLHLAFFLAMFFSGKDSISKLLVILTTAIINLKAILKNDKTSLLKFKFYI